MPRVERIACPVEVEKPKRFFTLDEANRALVLVRRIVADMVVEYSRLLDVHEEAEAAEAVGDADLFDVARQDMARSAQALRTCLDELDHVGAYVTDWMLGMIEFPSVLAGREVCLCWRHGQGEIRTWREMDDPAQADKPIALYLAERDAAPYAAASPRA